MIKRVLVMSWVMSGALAMPSTLWADQPSVQVEPPNLQGSRPVEKQTETAVIRDYLQSWESLRAAMQQNHPDLLDRDFVGTARDKLTETIQQQARLGIRSRYRDRSHDLRIVFYSPEGLSIQLIDNVEYDEQVLDQGKIVTTQHIRARYIVVMTPAETRWRVRVFQGAPE
jgi:hypothetical protein